MAKRPNPIASSVWEPTCSRSQYLDEQAMYQKEREAFEECRKINTKPGYEVLTKMRINGGK